MFKRARLLGQTQIHLIVWSVAFALGLIFNLAAGVVSLFGGGVRSYESAAEPAPAEAVGLVVLEVSVSDTWLNVRSAPSTTESQILAQLNPGTVLVAEERPIQSGDMSWYRIVSLVDKDAWRATDSLQAVHGKNMYPYVSADFVRPYSGGLPVRNILDRVKAAHYAEGGGLGGGTYVAPVAAQVKYTRIADLAKEVEVSRKAAYAKYNGKRMELAGRIEHNTWWSGPRFIVDNIHCFWRESRVIERDTGEYGIAKFIGADGVRLPCNVGETIYFEGVIDISMNYKKPTEEEILAAEEENGESYFGIPNGPLNISDCTIISSATLAERAPETGKKDAAPKGRVVGPYTPKIIYDIGRFPAPRPANTITEIFTLSTEAGRLLDPNVEHVRESGLMANYDADSLRLELQEIEKAVRKQAIDLDDVMVATLKLGVTLFDMTVVASELGFDTDDRNKRRQVINMLLLDIKAKAVMGEPWK
jgi:hypothetical protein